MLFVVCNLGLILELESKKVLNFNQIFINYVNFAIYNFCQNKEKEINKNGEYKERF